MREEGCHLRNHVCTANRSRQRNNKSDDSGKSLRIEKVSHNNIKLIDRREEGLPVSAFVSRVNLTIRWIKSLL